MCKDLTGPQGCNLSFVSGHAEGAPDAIITLARSGLIGCPSLSWATSSRYQMAEGLQPSWTSFAERERIAGQSRQPAVLAVQPRVAHAPAWIPFAERERVANLSGQHVAPFLQPTIFPSSSWIPFAEREKIASRLVQPVAPALRLTVSPSSAWISLAERGSIALRSAQPADTALQPTVSPTPSWISFAERERIASRSIQPVDSALQSSIPPAPPWISYAERERIAVRSAQPSVPAPQPSASSSPAWVSHSDREKARRLTCEAGVARAPVKKQLIVRVPVPLRSGGTNVTGWSYTVFSGENARLKKTDVADLPDVDAFEPAPENLGLLSLVESTRSSYAGAFARLLTWSKSRCVEDIPQDWFLSLCMTFATSGYSVSHLESYRSALAFFQRTHVKCPRLRWSQDPGFQTDFRGLLAICKPPTVVGAIGVHNKRLDQLLGHVADHLPSVYGLGIRIAHPTLVRHSELLILRPCDFAVSGSDVVVTVIGPKGHKTSDGGKPAVFLVKAPGIGPLVTSLLNGRHPFQPLFPEWDQILINEAIRAAAARFEWDPTMRWSFHSLRHGMAQDMNQENIPLSERMMRGRWSSGPQSDHYARPDVTEVCTAAELRVRLADLSLAA